MTRGRTSSEVLPDRASAGRRLADRLVSLAGTSAIVLALPRGGVPVAFEIARRLGLPLDVCIARKLGAPDNPEYALGAISEGGVRLIDAARAEEAGYRPEDLEPIVARETAELERRAREYRSGRAPPETRDRTVVLVDDGVATGATVRAAIRSVRAGRPARIIVALGVAPPDTVERLGHEADEVIALLEPPEFFAVGEWYREFGPVSDAEVRRLLETARHPI